MNPENNVHDSQTQIVTKVLVTGGAGYVGSHACKVLASEGHQSIVFDNLSRGHLDFVRWGLFENGDLLDAARLREVFLRHRPDAVMHFAAFAYVGESVEQPEIYYRNNVVGSLTLLETMYQCGVRSIVFSSTCAVYGIPARMPIIEDAPLQPINPYGHSKLTVERMLEDFEVAHGIRSVSLRYFNAAGADPDAEIGERHAHETHAIPLAVLAGLGKGDNFRLFGDDYDTPDGTAIRDYVHVNDLAVAHVAALDHLAGGGESVAVNMGTGHGTSVRELIDSVERVTGRQVPVDIAPRRPGDPPVLVADSASIQSKFGWQPRFQSIDEIVATAVRWHEKDA
jgi:UDP-arabinose 4-epimerase